jgi:hypothetical protein
MNACVLERERNLDWSDGGELTTCLFAGFDEVYWSSFLQLLNIGKSLSSYTIGH